MDDERDEPAECRACGRMEVYEDHICEWCGEPSEDYDPTPENSGDRYGPSIAEQYAQAWDQKRALRGF